MIKTFTIIRNGDESGVSGTGRILDGIVFHNGKTVVCWRTDVDGTQHGDSSIGVYDSFGAFKRIHIDSHPSNDTEIHYNPLTDDLLNNMIEVVKDKSLDKMDLDIPVEGPNGKKLNKEQQLRLRVCKYMESNKS